MLLQIENRVMNIVIAIRQSPSGMCCEASCFLSHNLPGPPLYCNLPLPQARIRSLYQWQQSYLVVVAVVLITLPLKPVSHWPPFRTRIQHTIDKLVGAAQSAFETYAGQRWDHDSRSCYSPCIVPWNICVHKKIRREGKRREEQSRAEQSREEKRRKENDV
jgi:hypothetical protein